MYLRARDCHLLHEQRTDNFIKRKVSNKEAKHHYLIHQWLKIHMSDQMIKINKIYEGYTD